MSFLALEGVGKRYGTAAALDGIDLAVQAGQRVAIVGPSGSGKTTLLRLIAGFEGVDAGRVTLDGVVLDDGRAAVPSHRRGVGVVMQDGALFPHLSVADNIGFGLPRRARDRDRVIGRLMRMVDLDPALLARRPDALSGGQQQRVALARALAASPRLMLLDEPFSALDTALRASTRQGMMDLLGAAGITTILVTHDQNEAMSFADHLAVLADGRLLQAGPPRTLYARPATAMVARFLGPALILPARLSGGQGQCALGAVRLAPEVEGRSPHEGVVMIRPEQVSLTGAAGAVEADVRYAEFAGSTTTVELVVRGADGLHLSIAVPSHATPEPGSVVRIAVDGPVHVLPAPPQSAPASVDLDPVLSPTGGSGASGVGVSPAERAA
ncbi:MAG: ABC transporter ATP-binding protein [Janthinobacterium lividum]